MNYWLLGLLIASNVALSFYLIRAAGLSRALRKLRKKSEGLSKRVYDPDMLAFLEASPISGLAVYAERRLPFQEKVANLLPAADCDLAALREQTVGPATYDQTIPRLDMENHRLRLRASFEGSSELSFLNALCIAYLRRRTPHTRQARTLFRRIWREQGEFLANEISTRWLLSTLMTFADHGETYRQRLIGASGSAFANTAKIYEWERAASGPVADADAFRQNYSRPITGIRGFGAVSGEGNDIFRNTLSFLTDHALREPVAGRVMLTVLVRLHEQDTLFTRLDLLKLEIEAGQAEGEEAPRHWSFGDHPTRPDE